MKKRLDRSAYSHMGVACSVYDYSVNIAGRLQVHPYVFYLMLFLFSFYGCRTTKPLESRIESRKEVKEVLSSMAGAIVGKELSDEELRALEKQIRTDKEARSAVEVITNSVGGVQRQIKYCPVTGKRYAGHMQVCPEHQVELEIVK